MLRLPVDGPVPQAFCDAAPLLAHRKGMSAANLLLLIHRAFFLLERCGARAATFKTQTLAATLLCLAAEFEGASVFEGAAAECADGSEVSAADFSGRRLDDRDLSRCKCAVLNDLGQRVSTA